MNNEPLESLLMSLEKLKTAEMAYKIAHAVNIECSNSEEQRFHYPQIYSHGKHTVTYEEFSLNAVEEEFAAAALLHCARYTMVVQMDTAMQKALSDRFKHPDMDIQGASWIIRLIRNAFAHDPFNPTWLTYPECDNCIFTVKEVVSISTNGLNGKRMVWDDYGGPLALLKLSEFVRKVILKEIEKITS